MTRIAIALAQDFADWEPALLAAAALAISASRSFTQPGRPARGFNGRAQRYAQHIL